MKCEKCGIDILEGNLCDNCKNNNVTVESVQPVVNTVPQAYDPVADLMNEPVNETVNLEKNELENEIPVGDNSNIPEVPTAENVVSVTPEVVNETPVVESVASEPVVTPTPGPIPTEVTPNQVVSNSEEVAPKKKNTTVIIICIVAAVLLVILFWLLPFLKRVKDVNDMFDTADVNRFVTEVQEYMNASSTKFMTDALKPENQGKSLEFTTNGNSLEMSGEPKQYKFNLDRNGSFTSIIIFDKHFCYMVSNGGDRDFKIDKTIVTVNDIQKRTDNDNLNQGCFGEKVN